MVYEISEAKYFAYFGFKLAAYGISFPLPQPISSILLAFFRSSMLTRV
jgi:hypothetical protein